MKNSYTDALVRTLLDLREEHRRLVHTVEETRRLRQTKATLLKRPASLSSQLIKPI